MKYSVSYERLEPDTIRGEAVKITQIYSSFNKEDIDSIENVLKETYKTVTTSEVEND